MVETAIVLPLFTFMVLGLLQLGLLYQAKAILKYAAYRAARAGALHNACQDKMNEAALAVLLPVLSLNGASLAKSDSPADYSAALQSAGLFGVYPDDATVEIVKTRVCGPIKDWVSGSASAHPGGGQNEVDFDDPGNNATSADNSHWKTRMKELGRTKLRVQVRLNLRMIIPFANMMIFQIWTGQQVAEVMRTGGPGGPRTHSNDQGKRIAAESGNAALLAAVAASSGHYYLPMYANYAFRMQSNFFLSKSECQLPQQNECWHYPDGNAADGDP